jgi:hypothetical protein
MLVPRTDFSLRCRWFLLGPDNVLYETEYRESDTDEQGEIVCFYRLWRYGVKSAGEPPFMVWRQSPHSPLRVVLLNTMPAWWVEPRDMEKHCTVWEEMAPANPLPLGWSAPLGQEGPAPRGQPLMPSLDPQAHAAE